jgi:hypothetical protein
MIDILLKFFLATFISFLFTFMIINLILGCETWNQELWTETNSCMSFEFMFNSIIK